jgi:hypothetical protein
VPDRKPYFSGSLFLTVFSSSQPLSNSISESTTGNNGDSLRNPFLSGPWAFLLSRLSALETITGERVALTDADTDQPSFRDNKTLNADLAVGRRKGSDLRNRLRGERFIRMGGRFLAQVLLSAGSEGPITADTTRKRGFATV